MVTLRTVCQDQELTLCYNNFLESDGPVTRSERRIFLEWGYRFICHCEDCRLEGGNKEANDRARQRIVLLRLDWSLATDLAKERRIIAEQIRLLTQLDYCGRMEYIIQAAECGLETETDPRRIAQLRDLALRYSALLCGESSKEI